MTPNEVVYILTAMNFAVFIVTMAVGISNDVNNRELIRKLASLHDRCGPPVSILIRELPRVTLNRFPEPVCSNDHFGPLYTHDQMREFARENADKQLEACREATLEVAHEHR